MRIAKRRSRLLIFQWGKRLSATLCCNHPIVHNARTCPRGRDEHPVRSAPKTKLRPTIRAGCAAGESTDGTRGLLTLRRFTPDAGGPTFPSFRACMLFTEALAAINFRRGIVRPKEL
jgi:hypothetical protein